MTPNEMQIPSEWWQLLVRIDERTKGIEASLTDIKNSHADLEGRLRKVEDEQKVREGLKDRYVATEKLATDLDRRVSAMEATDKAGNSFLDYVIRLAPSVVIVILFIGALAWQGKNTDKRIEAMEHRAPPAVVQTVTTPD